VNLNAAPLEAITMRLLLPFMGMGTRPTASVWSVFVAWHFTGNQWSAQGA